MARSPSRSDQAAIPVSGSSPFLSATTTAATSSPRAVTRGETPPELLEGFGFSVDWLSFTYAPGPCGDWRADLRRLFGRVLNVHEWVESSRGWQGYTNSAKAEGVLIAWGGEAQRGSVHVEIPGGLAGSVCDWSPVVDFLAVHRGRITRADVAADDYLGSRLSVAWGRRQFYRGKFITSGRPPVARVIDDMGSDKGKTLYVGQRANGKLLRLYEKGKQLGDKLSKWVRAEVEFRSKDRVIPLDLLLSPREYVAGAYPALGFLSSVTERIATVKARAVIGYAKLVEITRLHAGRAINAMLQVANGDIGAVFGQLRRSGLPSRLNAAELRSLSGSDGGGAWAFS